MKASHLAVEPSLEPTSHPEVHFTPATDQVTHFDQHQATEAALTRHYAGILRLLPKASRGPGLQDTPKRTARALLELTKGYHANIKEIVNHALFPCRNAGMVTIQQIPFSSLCEHHLLPFYGHCTVAYLPQAKVIGLSKVPRLVEVFSKRLQIQEQLTHDIAECIADVTEALGVAVMIEAEHMCMRMRGVCTLESQTRTETFLGDMKQQPHKQAFYQACQSRSR